MPSALKYPRSLESPDAQAIETAFTKEYDERAKKLARHWAYYDGIMPRSMKLEKDGVDDNIYLPKVDQVADKVVSFLLGDGIRFDVGGDDQPDEQDDAVAQLWEANASERLLHNLALSGPMSGHCWMRAEP